jgi:nucleotide-binding universal stress UspA family protein
MRTNALRILLATDLSPAADAAAVVALDYARRLSAALHVLHVTHEGAQAEMARVVRDHTRGLTGVPVVVAVEAGGAAERIVRYARENRMDLVVLGTHGRTGFTRALLDSVTDRVARSAPCPVMTVPPAAAVVEGADVAAVAAVNEEEETRGCLVCGALCQELICEPCRARIRGEALDRKREEYRQVPI